MLLLPHWGGLRVSPPVRQCGCTIFRKQNAARCCRTGSDRKLKVGKGLTRSETGPYVGLSITQCTNSAQWWTSIMQSLQPSGLGKQHRTSHSPHDKNMQHSPRALLRTPTLLLRGWPRHRSGTTTDIESFMFRSNSVTFLAFFFFKMSKLQGRLLHFQRKMSRSQKNKIWN